MKERVSEGVCVCVKGKNRKMLHPLPLPTSGRFVEDVFVFDHVVRLHRDGVLCVVYFKIES